MAKDTAVAGMPNEQDWMAENDMRTLVEAEKIRKDKKRLSAALKKRDEMVAAMAAVSKGNTNEKGKA